MKLDRSPTASRYDLESSSCGSSQTARASHRRRSDGSVEAFRRHLEAMARSSARECIPTTIGVTMLNFAVISIVRTTSQARAIGYATTPSMRLRRPRPRSSCRPHSWPKAMRLTLLGSDDGRPRLATERTRNSDAVEACIRARRTSPTASSTLTLPVQCSMRPRDIGAIRLDSAYLMCNFRALGFIGEEGTVR